MSTGGRKSIFLGTLDPHIFRVRPPIGISIRTETHACADPASSYHVGFFPTEIRTGTPLAAGVFESTSWYHKGISGFISG